MKFFKKLFTSNEPKPLPLPIGRAEYDAWSRRIIEGASIPGLAEDSANFALTSMLLHLPSTQSFHTDAFFVHALRKSAINQTAVAVMQEIEARSKAKKQAEQQQTQQLKIVKDATPEAVKPS
jgi:hypothetical protein